MRASFLVLGDCPFAELFLKALGERAVVVGNPSWWEKAEGVYPLSFRSHREILGLARQMKVKTCLAIDERPCKAGLVDYLVRKGEAVLGVRKKLWQEYQDQKNFWELLRKYHLPLPEGRWFDNPLLAKEYAASFLTFPVQLRYFPERKVYFFNEANSLLPFLEQCLKQPKSVDAPRHWALLEEGVPENPRLYSYYLHDGDTFLPLGTVQGFWSFEPEGKPCFCHIPVGGKYQKPQEEMEKEVLFPLAHLLTGEKKKYRGVLEILWGYDKGVFLFHIAFFPSFLPWMTLLLGLKKPFGEILHLAARRKLHRFQGEVPSLEPVVTIGVAEEKAEFGEPAPLGVVEIFGEQGKQKVWMAKGEKVKQIKKLLEKGLFLNQSWVAQFVNSLEV